MSVAASVTSKQPTVVVEEGEEEGEEEVEEELENETVDTRTVYQNQKVIDAAEGGVTYKVCVALKTRHVCQDC
jgi:hypothetical protein